MGVSGSFSLNDEFILDFICQRFRLGSIRHIDGPIGGAYNVNIKLQTSEGEFVVRVLNSSNTAEHLRCLHKVLIAAREAGVPVVLPLLSIEGDSFILCMGKLIQVTRFVEMGLFQNRQGQVLASGRKLREFHDALQTMPVAPKPEWSFNRGNDYFTNALSTLETVSGIPEHQLADARQLSEKILQLIASAEAGLERSILHGDWHFWNQGYADDEVVCVLDFDFVEQGYRIHDVAYALWVIYMLLPAYARSFDEDFLKGYGPLTDAEANILPVAVAKTALFFLCHAAYSDNPRDKWRRHYRKQMPLIRWLLDDGGQRLHDLTSGKQGAARNGDEEDAG
ncbi:phosphotransferase [Paenibacillus puerhi]|uniref:phosphotransferase n=1 Tax=Paenibacillus puerhi TaxID=2692622 RepID=UPI00135B40A7|nr:phosphotransferase [Paenibacillus puerhi]